MIHDSVDCCNGTTGIHQPFVVNQEGNLSASSKKLLQFLEKQKDSLNKHHKSTGVGVRG